MTGALTCEETYEEGKVHPIREMARIRLYAAPGGGQRGGMLGWRSLQGCSDQRCSFSISCVPVMCHVSEGCGSSSFALSELSVR